MPSISISGAPDDPGATIPRLIAEASGALGLSTSRVPVAVVRRLPAGAARRYRLSDRCEDRQMSCTSSHPARE